MIKNETVEHIMTKNVHSIEVSAGLKKALSAIKKHHIRHLPVVDKGAIVGIISSSDLNRLSFGSVFEQQESADESILEMLTIANVMSHKPRVVNIGSQIREVAEIFAKESFHSLPVVDDGKLVGIITTTDVIKYMLSQF
jgi:CBS-domain-containing membrane protein